MKRKPPGRPRLVRSPENVDTVRRAVLASPRRSVRRQALALGTSRRSLLRTLHEDLQFHPYKIITVQQLTKGDFAQRREFCEKMLTILTENANDVVMMSDEAHFHLNGFVKKQNCRFWSEENPREAHQISLHSLKVTVWCGVSKLGIVGPYFFKKMYTNRPRTIQELKLFFRQEIAAVAEDMLENAMQNFEERHQMCVQEEGSNLTDIIFRT
ncbi:hypothetical protein B7P43_G05966 [Cryptotermes secundus]|uniref:Tc1-like transposase DDE domain-containing protein n=1 Tax=Cryptotermes secundus TaxID=105785 RepID=A0A2J7PZT8_9NEOP|nr:hypothetical protein B7P43_G05966 [Cryptotermes secundus]